MKPEEGYSKGKAILVSARYMVRSGFEKQTGRMLLPGAELYTTFPHI